MAQWVKVKVKSAKPKDLSSILRTHAGEGANQLQKVVLWLSHVCHVIVRSILWCHEKRGSQGWEVEEPQAEKTYFIHKYTDPSQAAISSHPDSCQDTCRLVHKPCDYRHLTYRQTHTRPYLYRITPKWHSARHDYTTGYITLFLTFSGHLAPVILCWLTAPGYPVSVML